MVTIHGTPIVIDPIGLGFIIMSIAALFIGRFHRPVTKPLHNHTRRTHHGPQDRIHQF